MIGYIRGTVVLISEIDDREIIVEAGQSGVGYRIMMASSNTAGMTVGQNVELHIYTQVREDAIELYGFKTRDERMLFTRLVTVKGVGAKMALSVLNALSPSELRDAVLTADTATLRSIPGIGPKVAGRLILELESFFQSCHFGDIIPSETAARKPRHLHADTRSALMNLGFNETETDNVLSELDNSGESFDSIQDEIRWCLRHKNA